MINGLSKKDLIKQGKPWRTVHEVELAILGMGLIVQQRPTFYGGPYGVVVRCIGRHAVPWCITSLGVWCTWRIVVNDHRKSSQKRQGGF